MIERGRLLKRERKRERERGKSLRLFAIIIQGEAIRKCKNNA